MTGQAFTSALLSRLASWYEGKGTILVDVLGSHQPSNHQLREGPVQVVLDSTGGKGRGVSGLRLAGR